MEEIKQLVTEQENKNTKNFSSLSIYEAIQLMHQESYQAFSCIESQFKKIEKVIQLTVNVLENDGRLIYLGAGTSGRLGVLEAVECPPTFGVSDQTVLGIVASQESAFTKPRENAEDSKEEAIHDLKEIQLNEKDIVIGSAASGRTPYVVGGIEYAQNVGAQTAAIVCNPNSVISEICENTIEIISGNEVVTGSTRLKAGTATKLVMNMISTISMTKLGKVYQNYMVDVQLSNEKLVKRGIGIIVSVCECSEQFAQQVLKEANYDVKKAIVMILLGCDQLEAENRLNQVKGRIDDLL